MTPDWAMVILGALAGVTGIGVLFIQAIPVLERKRNARFLRSQISLGLFDADTVAEATRWYVRPKCSGQDPASLSEEQVAGPREDLFTSIDAFLSPSSSCRHLLLLGDSGTGKTSFVLNYYAYNSQKRERKPIALVSLGVPNSEERIAQISGKGETALFLDAFDEDPNAGGDYQTRLCTLMEACSCFRRVVITCRTQFFPRDDEIPVETDIVNIGPRKAGESATYKFRRLYLCPFGDREVRAYLRLRYPVWQFRSRRRARRHVRSIPSLSARPMLLSYLPDLIAARGAERLTTSCRLYEALVSAWLQREADGPAREELREVSERLAVYLHVNRAALGTDRLPKARLAQLCTDWGVGVPTREVTNRSLLNRDAHGNLKFAHRSILEYLFVCRLDKDDPATRGVVLTDQMKSFLLEWSSLCPVPIVGFGPLSPVTGSRAVTKALAALEVAGRPIVGLGFDSFKVAPTRIVTREHRRYKATTTTSVSCALPGLNGTYQLAPAHAIAERQVQAHALEVDIDASQVRTRAADNSLPRGPAPASLWEGALWLNLREEEDVERLHTLLRPFREDLPEPLGKFCQTVEAYGPLRAALIFTVNLSLAAVCIDGPSPTGTPIEVSFPSRYLTTMEVRARLDTERGSVEESSTSATM